MTDLHLRQALSDNNLTYDSGHSLSSQNLRSIGSVIGDFKDVSGYIHSMERR
jgi:hypothetical protein